MFAAKHRVLCLDEVDGGTGSVIVGGLERRAGQMDSGDCLNGTSDATRYFRRGVRITDRLSGHKCVADERNMDGRIRLEEEVPDASNHSGR